MVKSNLDKFLLLLWKNWALEWNKKIRLVVQLIIPLLLLLIFVPFRLEVHPSLMDGITYKDPLPIDNLNLFKTHYNEEQTVGTKPLKFHLGFSPSTSAVYNQIANAAAKNLQLTFSGYVDAKELQYAVIKENFLAGIEFVDSVKTRKEYPKRLQYRIRFPSEPRTTSQWPLAWYTTHLYPTFSSGMDLIDTSSKDLGPRNIRDADGGNPAGYLREGFLPVQNAIATAFISQSAQGGTNLPKIFLQRYPYPEYISDPFLSIVGSVINVSIVIGFLYPFVVTVQSITYEKEKQLKEVMKMMGLQNWIHWTAWFAKSILMMGISSLLITIILKHDWSKDSILFTYSSFTTVLFFLLMYNVSTITLCFFLSTCFSKSNSATGMSVFIFFITYLPYNILEPNYNSLSLSRIMGCCLLPNSAVSFGMRLILLFESNGYGLHWNNITEPPPGDKLAVSDIIGMMILSSCICMLLCLYIEQIHPGDFGIAKKWDFPFKKSFWSGEDQQTGTDHSSNSIDRGNSLAFETEPVGKHAGVEVKNLSKTFGDMNAVKGLSLNMYEDEITALLGHNGAGKTTTISMLTGMFPPTSGTATINGYDIRTDMDGARLSMGLCPQHNILYDDLTVKDHLIFYSRMKGLKGAALKEEVAKYIKKIELEDKANVASSKLSGGMKRKLSVCAAICGGTKVVMFDEPSAGMDPAARRQLWNLLQSEKTGRTMLLTTHYMDEADVLGDRIAIMSGGELKCLGTSFFLKKQFGSGYRLICAKKSNCDSTKVTKLLSKYIPGIVPEAEIGAELSYQLPESYSSNFEKMLQDLEKNSEQLELEGYGISIHSLEDVVMKMDAENEEESAIGKGYRFSDKVHLHRGYDKLLNQWRAMFLKKYLHIKGNKIVFFLMNFSPIIFLAIMFFFTGDIFSIQTPMTPSLSQYSKTVTVLDTNPNVKPGSLEERISENYKKIIDSFGPNHEFRKADATGFINFIIKLGQKMQPTIKSMYIAAATVNDGSIIAWLNNEVLHSAPVTLNLIHNAIAKTVIGPQASITVTNAPLPLASDFKEDDIEVLSIAAGLQHCLCFVGAFFVIFVIKEQQSRAKLLQLVSGIKVVTFWLSHFVSDMLMFMFTSIIIIFTLLCFQQQNFDTLAQLGRIFIFLILFGCAIITFTYLISGCFVTPSKGFLLLLVLCILLGEIPVLILTILKISNVENAETVEQILRVFPQYSFITGVMNLYRNADLHRKCELVPGPDPCVLVPACCSLTPYFAWEDPGVRQELTYFFWTSIGFLLVLLIKDYGIVQFIFTRLRNIIRSQPKRTDGRYVDDDVEEEKRKIKKMSRSEIARQNLVLDRLTKFYGTFVAVNQISLAVKHSECFGLLGINGAGKTTTFKMLTGDVLISLGEAYVKGYRLKTNMRKIYPEIGYCPQFDALFEEFTGSETLRIFCLIRGIPIAIIPQVSTDVARSFGFIQHIDKAVHSYSGGNKRKLSTAIATLGSPSVIYLDEPTAGMDPAARRQIWTMISKIRSAGKSIVLTSHNMEECEALCTRLAVMVNGEFKCLGSIQHLKNKFSKGFILKLKMEKDRDRDQSIQASDDRFSNISRLEGEEDVNIIRVREFIAKEFPNAYCKEHFQSIFTFFIPSAGLMWSKIFGLIESNKNKLKIEDYSLTQTTLEQIFLDFAEQQHDTE